MSAKDETAEPWALRGLIEDALARSCDDWLHVAEFSAIARRAGVSGSEGVRTTAIGLIAIAVAENLMIIGDVDEFGFHEWTGTSAEAIVRLIQSWDPNEPYPTPGSVAWLAGTQKGKKIGEAVLQRESSS